VNIYLAAFLEPVLGRLYTVYAGIYSVYAGIYTFSKTFPQTLRNIDYIITD